MDASPTPARAIELFYSYSHKDEEFREQVETHLALLKRQGVLKDWHDRRIGAGMEWKDEIDDHLNAANIILLLISPDFIASDYCYDIEMNRALERHEAGEARVIPVILRYVDNWEKTQFGKLQALPKNGKPVRSWADRDEAFADVAQGIRKAVEELLSTRPASLTPATSGQAAIWNVPHRRNPHFTGREQLLDDLHSALRSSQTAALTQAITGLGGVGKTQTAVEYAYRFASSYDVVWWMRAEEPATLASDYAGLATALDLPEKGYKEQNFIGRAVYRWLQKHGCWLLIFDNAQEPADLQAYVPTKSTGHILVTSRNPNWSDLAQVLAVRTWMREESTAFLLQRTHQSDKAAAIELAEALGDLPLALAQAASYIEQTARSIESYRLLFETRGQELRRLGQPSPDYPNTVATTWDLSFHHVEGTSPAAADLMSLCAFLAPDSIPVSTLAGGSEYLTDPLAVLLKDPLALDEAVATLRRYSLLEARDDSLSIHRLVQAVTRDRMTESARQKWVSAGVQIICAAFPEHSEDATMWALSSRLVPHAETSLANVEKLSPSTTTKGKLHNRLGRYFFGRADFVAARRHFELALSSDESVCGPTDSALATDHNDLGLALQSAGDLNGARIHLERALSIDEKVNGSVHSDVARDLSNLGNLLIELGDLRTGREHLERAIMIDEQVSGPDHPDVARDLNNLGNALREMGDPGTAKKRIERGLGIATTAYGPNHPKVASNLNNLGNTLRELGYPHSALEHLERALVIDEAVYGRNHPKVAVDLNDVGNALRELGEPRSAVRQIERALMIDEAVYGPNHSTVAGDLNNLGNALHEAGDPHNAKEHIERALRIAEEAYGLNHPRVATVLNSLGTALQQIGEERKAKELIERALRIDRAVYGPNHLKIARDLHNLGTTLAHLGIHPGALTYLQQAYSMFAQLLGKDHPNTIRALRDLNAVRLRHGFMPVFGSAQRRKASRRK